MWFLNVSCKQSCLYSLVGFWKCLRIFIGGKEWWDRSCWQNKQKNLLITDHQRRCQRIFLVCVQLVGSYRNRSEGVVKVLVAVMQYVTSFSLCVSALHSVALQTGTWSLHTSEPETHTKRERMRKLLVIVLMSCVEGNHLERGERSKIIS